MQVTEQHSFIGGETRGVCNTCDVVKAIIYVLLPLVSRFLMSMKLLPLSDAESARIMLDRVDREVV